MSSRVKLPPGIRQPFAVYVNGVEQQLGRDYRVRAGELEFERELHNAKPGRFAWFLGAWGIGTYEKNDVIDVRYETSEGVPTVAHALQVSREPAK